MAEEFKAIYACEKYAGFAFRAGKTRHKFEKHQLIIIDKEIADEIDACIKKYPTIASKIKKVDLSVAEALVANHKATHGGAHTGPFSSSAMSGMEAAKLDQRDVSLDQLGKESKDKLIDAAAADSDLILTEKTPVIAPVVTKTPLVENKPVATSPIGILKAKSDNAN